MVENMRIDYIIRFIRPDKAVLSAEEKPVLNMAKLIFFFKLKMPKIADWNEYNPDFSFSAGCQTSINFIVTGNNYVYIISLFCIIDKRILPVNDLVCTPSAHGHCMVTYFLVP